MTAMKLAGGVLIIGATTLLGFFMSQRSIGRGEELLEMKKALTMLKSEIRFALTPFGEAALSIAERVMPPVSDIFSYAGRNALLKNENEAFDLWEKAVDSVLPDSCLSNEDVKAFMSMGKSLGYLDKEMQSQSIDLLIEYIDTTVAQLRESNAKQTKMYRSLGVLSGALIIVVLI